MLSNGRGLLARGERARLSVASMAAWPRRRWVVAIVAAVIAALIVGVPTGILHTALFTRMTPVLWWNYPVWLLSALLVGLTAATYVRVPDAALSGSDRGKRTLGATLLTGFAVGCPICNKLVVGLIGASGALNYWAPLQPLLGVLSVSLLSAGLVVRLRGTNACPTPAAG